eukprot:Platyproteum_vivax@DN7194_c0_g1_i2.p1
MFNGVEGIERLEGRSGERQTIDKRALEKDSDEKCGVTVCSLTERHSGDEKGEEEVGNSMSHGAQTGANMTRYGNVAVSGMYPRKQDCSSQQRAKDTRSEPELQTNKSVPDDISDVAPLELVAPYIEKDHRGPWHILLLECAVSRLPQKTQEWTEANCYLYAHLAERRHSVCEGEDAASPCMTFGKLRTEVQWADLNPEFSKVIEVVFELQDETEWLLGLCVGIYKHQLLQHDILLGSIWVPLRHVIQTDPVPDCDIICFPIQDQPVTPSTECYDWDFSKCVMSGKIYMKKDTDRIFEDL